jgi:hypothetical protein
MPPASCPSSKSFNRDPQGSAEMPSPGWPGRPGRAAGSRSDKKQYHSHSSHNDKFPVIRSVEGGMFTRHRNKSSGVDAQMDPHGAASCPDDVETRPVLHTRPGHPTSRSPVNSPPPFNGRTRTAPAAPATPASPSIFSELLTSSRRRAPRPRGPKSGTPGVAGCAGRRYVGVAVCPCRTGKSQGRWT